MTCPRCQSKTDRTVIQVTMRPWATSVRREEPLICTHCLDEWEVRRVTDSLMLLQSDVKQTK